MRYLYSTLFYLALPFIFLRLLWRSRRLAAYRYRLGERLGFYSFGLEKCIWVHAVSVGETIAAIPMILALKARYPNIPLLVTTMTPTGAARVVTVFGQEVKHAYIPYDVPGAVKRFLQAMRPVACIIIETELWPNLVAACYARHIPIFLMNARLSAQSARGYARVASLARSMLAQIDSIAAVGQADADRFIALGARKECVQVTGNIKFDVDVSMSIIEAGHALRAQLGRERFVWIAASTHAGEESIILEAHQLLRLRCPDALLILVPRHPDRFDVVYQLCAERYRTARRSINDSMTEDTAVFLGDSMGEMLQLYGAADVAFVGGSFIPRGGHNILEPAILGKPILTGASLYNFADISDLFLQQHALTVVSDAYALAGELVRLMEQPSTRQVMGERAMMVVEANRGALKKQLAVVALED